MSMSLSSNKNCLRFNNCQTLQYCSAIKFKENFNRFNFCTKLVVLAKMQKKKVSNRYIEFKGYVNH